MSAAKVLGMVLLVVLPGGSLVLLAIAAYRAWKQGRGPFAHLKPAELRRYWVAAMTWLTRSLHLPQAWAPNRA